MTMSTKMTPRTLEGMTASAAIWTGIVAATIQAKRVSPRERWKPTRTFASAKSVIDDRERDEQAAAVSEVLAEARVHEPAAGQRVEDGQERAEPRRDEQRAPEDVRRVLAARLPRSRPREEHRQDRRGQEEGDAREGRRGRVLARLVAREARVDDEEIDVREHRDPEQADENRPEVAEEPGELAERRGAHVPRSTARGAARARLRSSRTPPATAASTAPPSS